MTDDPQPDDPVDQPDERDQALLVALGRAIGPVDDTELIARCADLLTWIDVDAELATLLDAAPAELAGTRGAASHADLEFTVEDGACVIELSIGDDNLRGQILGVAPERVALRTVTGALQFAELDEVGAFTVEAPPTGGARLELDLAEGRRIHTDWFVI